MKLFCMIINQAFREANRLWLLLSFSYFILFVLPSFFLGRRTHRKKKKSDAQFIQNTANYLFSLSPRSYSAFHPIKVAANINHILVLSRTRMFYSAVNNLCCFLANFLANNIVGFFFLSSSNVEEMKQMQSIHAIVFLKFIDFTVWWTVTWIFRQVGLS